MEKPTKKNKTYIELLKEDHDKVKALFKKFKKTKEDSSKRTIVETILKELTVHAKAEEEIIYPEFRKVLKEDLVDEADIEHHLAKVLIEELSQMKPGDDHYEARVTVLGEIIDHHVEEEEGEIFPKAKKEIRNPEEITARLAARKKSLTAEIEI